MLCDPGDRYLDTYYNKDWLEEKGFDLKPYLERLEQFYDSGIMGDDDTLKHLLTVYFVKSVDLTLPYKAI